MTTEFLITFCLFQILFGASLIERSRHYAKLRQRARDEIEALRAKRREDLTTRFGEENAARILAHEVWIGATYAMLWESIGYPDGITEKITARRERETYKYCETAKGRFALKVTVDDGIVTGWDGDRDAAAADARALEAQREYQAPVEAFWTPGKTVVASGVMALLVTGVRFCNNPKAFLAVPQSDIASPTASPTDAPPNASSARASPIPRTKVSAPLPRAPQSRHQDAGANNGGPAASALTGQAGANSQPAPSSTTTSGPKPGVDRGGDYE